MPKLTGAFMGMSGANAVPNRIAGIASFALRMNFSPPANETPRSMRVPVVTVLLKGCLFESAAADYRRRD